jgi:hypothetical protein
MSAFPHVDPLYLLASTAMLADVQAWLQDVDLASLAVHHDGSYDQAGAMLATLAWRRVVARCPEILEILPVPAPKPAGNGDWRTR